MEKEWYLIAGLGNPGREYEGTRHNTGFEVIDRLADRYDITGAAQTRSGKALTAKGRIEGQPVILMKPLTYMNLSGEAVREGLDYYHIDPGQHLIVISDDTDLPEGRIRLRTHGSAGGHNGLKNIILQAGTDHFIRVRVGIGAKPSPTADLADYVLGHAGGEDRKLLEEGEVLAADAVAAIVSDGVDRAMCRFN